MDKIRAILVQAYNESELRDLCFDLGVAFDSLPGESVHDKARELVAHCARHGELSKLAQAIYEARPHAAWRDLMDGAIRHDAIGSRPAGRLSDDRPTREFKPVQPIPSRTGPLRSDLHRALLDSIQRLNERVDDLGGLIFEWVNAARLNRLLIMGLLLLGSVLALTLGWVVLRLASM